MHESIPTQSIKQALKVLRRLDKGRPKIVAAYKVEKQPIGLPNIDRTDPEYPIRHTVGVDPGWSSSDIIQGNGFMRGKWASVNEAYTDDRGNKRSATGRVIGADGTIGAHPELGTNDPNSGFGVGLGNWLRRSSQDGVVGTITDGYDSGIRAGVLPAAATIGVPAWLLGKGYELISGNEGVADKLALGGLVAGGALGYMNKSSGDARATVVQALSNDYSLTPKDRADLIAGIAKADNSLLAHIAENLPMYSSAAAGALISRYLFKAGLVGTIIGALTGAAVSAINVTRIDSDHPYGAGRNWEGKSYYI